MGSDLLGFKYDNNEYHLSFCNTSQLVVELPSYYNDGINGTHPVTKILEGAFKDCSQVKEIFISQNIIVIEETFVSCYSLKEFKVDNKNINYYEVNGVLFTENTLVKYPNSRFGHYELPDFVEDWKYEAFSSCHKLLSLRLNHNLTWNYSELNYRFDGCMLLSDIYVDSHGLYFDHYGVLYLHLDDWGTYLLRYPPNKYFYQNLLFDNLAKITNAAFNNIKSLKNVIIPDGIKYIDISTFRGCENLSYVLLPYTLKGLKNEFYSHINSTSRRVKFFLQSNFSSLDDYNALQDIECEHDVYFFDDWYFDEDGKPHSHESK